MHRRYWTLVTVVTLLAGVALGAQERTVEETVSLQPSGTLTLDADRGSVRLTSWDQPQVEVRARIEPPSGVDADYALQAVEATRIEVESTDDGSVNVRANYRDIPRRDLIGRRLPRVHWEIRAPRQANLDLDIDRNEASVRGFEGRTAIRVDRSDLVLADLTGDVSVGLDRSHLDVSTVTGQLALTMDRGRDVVLDGVSASFTLDLDRTSVTMRNVDIDGDSEVDIDRGNLDLELDPDQALTIDANLSRRSEFSSDVPVTMRESGREVRGTINGGGPRLRIRADRGAIQLRTN